MRVCLRLLRVCVVPVLVRVLRHVEPREAGVRRVQHVHLDFIRHGLLMGQVVLRDLQAPHAVRLGPQHGLEFIAGTISK